MKVIKEKYPDLCLPFHKSLWRTAVTYISDRKRWWLVILLVVFGFLVGLSDLANQFTPIKLSFETAKIIVDQRATNTATIISMTLAVVGFLLSNLAVKESFAYRLFFKYSLVYPIIYFTLCTIASLIILSTLRNTITIQYVFCRAVLIGTFLVIIVLILIGYLFGSLIHFTNSKTIQQLLEKELITEARKVVKYELFIQHSEQIINEVFTNSNAQEYNFFTAFDYSEAAVLSNEEVGEVFEETTPTKFLLDINIADIQKFMRNSPIGEICYYKNLRIDNWTAESDNFVWFGQRENTSSERFLLRRKLYLVEDGKPSAEEFGAKKYFEEKLEEYSLEDKSRNMEGVLQSYLKLYQLEMKGVINES